MIVIQNSRNAELDEGKWAKFQGSEFLIAHTSSLRFQRSLQRLQAPFRKQIEKGTMDPEDSKIIVCRSMSEAILKDWRDVVGPDGAPLSYTKDLGYTALMNNEELREFVQEYSTELANFRAAEIEEKGNA